MGETKLFQSKDFIHTFHLHLRGFQMEVECVDEIFTLKQFSSKAIEKKQRERMYSL